MAFIFAAIIFAFATPLFSLSDYAADAIISIFLSHCRFSPPLYSRH